MEEPPPPPHTHTYTHQPLAPSPGPDPDSGLAEEHTRPLQQLLLEAMAAGTVASGEDVVRLLQVHGGAFRITGGSEGEKIIVCVFARGVCQRLAPAGDNQPAASTRLRI